MTGSRSHALHPHLNIAIDGPAGAGKSTIAKRIASCLGAVYIDTGAMYRACALKALRLGVSMSDEPQMQEMMRNTQIGFCMSCGSQRILLDGEDVTDFIRTPEVTKGSSDIARSEAVRHCLVDLQREIARRGDVVMDGRDIGSHVLRDARYKFFLTASDHVRANRRLIENQQKHLGLQTYDEVLADIRYRDIQDSTRKVSPLVRADDAVMIDTSDMDVEEVVRELLSRIEEKPAEASPC